MVDSPSSSEPSVSQRDGAVHVRRLRLGRLAATCLAMLLLALSAGCVTVRPSDKEFLSDPSMTFGDEGAAGAHEQHVMSNREGSMGAGSVSGGGCGCN